ncbi:MAG TPA: nucleotide exchange factor GrpE [Anaerolineales bacterium]|nr:nucleotide exchange factor GrpE [Anaerolineales bacterium]
MTPKKRKETHAAEAPPMAGDANEPGGTTPGVAQLQNDLAAAETKAEEYLQGWQRERSDFANYRRRIEREQSSGAQNALGSAIRRYLDIADDLERALKNRPAEGDGAAWAQGIDLIYRKLLVAFDADGVKPIEAEGKAFDPSMHEAISQEDSPEHESGQVIGVVQTGYILGERVLRPARVRVAR